MAVIYDMSSGVYIKMSVDEKDNTKVQSGCESKNKVRCIPDKEYSGISDQCES